MEIKSRAPGMVVSIDVKVGDAVKVKDTLMIMEAMKMKQKVISTVDGVVKEIKVKQGDRINAGVVVAIVE